MTLGIATGAFWLGIALGTSPGPVQLLLLSEAARGGAARGLRAMAGANATFGVLLVGLALGLAAIEPAPAVLRGIRVVGGAVLIAIAASAFRERRRTLDAGIAEPAQRPFRRGVLAVVVNPGLYLFVATTGAAVVAEGARAGGRVTALTTAVALLAGVCVTDGLTVALGAGSRRLPEVALRAFLDLSALALGGVGAWLVLAGIRG